MPKAVYLDCNATTPIEPRVREVLLHYLDEDFGNDGSRTHEYGMRAKKAVELAREQVAAPLKVGKDLVTFTSGATESNNLAILGLREYGEKTGRKHIISTAIEHKAVLEPIEALRRVGFSVTLLKANSNGTIDVSELREALKPDTLLVSVMHVNNETGAVQPLSDITAALHDHESFFHVDAAQGYGKRNADLQNSRIDLISISGHKVYGPKGVGALVARRRGYQRVPLAPLLFGGGQERGLRPGTVPVHLVAALGAAAELAAKEEAAWREKCADFKRQAVTALTELGASFTVLPEASIHTTINFSIPSVDSEALMLALKPLIAFSNGSACTSQSYTPSHVLKAMGLTERRIAECVRISWCHMTPSPNWDSIAEAVRSLQSA